MKKDNKTTKTPLLLRLLPYLSGVLLYIIIRYILKLY